MTVYSTVANFNFAIWFLSFSHRPNLTHRNVCQAFLCEKTEKTAGKNKYEAMIFDLIKSDRFHLRCQKIQIMANDRIKKRNRSKKKNQMKWIVSYLVFVRLNEGKTDCGE